MARRTLFCFGLGFTARRLGAILIRRGWRVVGTTRDADKAAEFRASGLEPAIFTGDAPLSGESRDALVSASHILLSIPPGKKGDAAFRFHGPDVAGTSRLEWLGYLSTTSVYGDHGGAWVSEDTPPTPTTERGERRLAAELQ